jgi:hypothetical protein
MTIDSSAVCRAPAALPCSGRRGPLQIVDLQDLHVAGAAQLSASEFRRLCGAVPVQPPICLSFERDLDDRLSWPATEAER